jgi:general secretion pathway protein M
MAPGWVSRLAALALSAGVAFALYLFVVAPIVTGYAETDAAVAQAAELLDRYRRVAAARPALQERLDALKSRQSEIGTYLSGETDALAGAELQELVNATVAKGGGGLRSVQILPVKADGGFRRIGVRVQMTATIAQVLRVLHGLEAGSTLLFVDNLEVSNRRARRRRNQPVEMDPTLLVRLDLFGYLIPRSGDNDS